MKDSEKLINTKSENPPKILSIQPFYPSSCKSPLSEALVDVSLPLSPEIVATDISLYDNKGVVEKLGVQEGEQRT